TLAGVAGVVSILIVLFVRIPVWSRLAIAGVIQAAFVWYLLVPSASEAQQRPVFEAAQFAKQLGQPIVTQSIDTPSFNVYLDKVTPRRPLEPGEIGYGREDRLDLEQHQILFQSGSVMIVRRMTEDEVLERNSYSNESNEEPATEPATEQEAETSKREVDE
ncbi:MAG: hypothetical protein ACPGYX_02435, partial [Oceanobacter sp.]